MEIMLLENILQKDCGLSDRQRQASIFPAVKPASRMLRAWLKKKTHELTHAFTVDSAPIDDPQLLKTI
jgi:hypothetical protein